MTGPIPGTLSRRIGLFLPGGGVADGAVDIAFELAEFGLEQHEMTIDGLEHAALGGHAAAVALGNHHLDDLATARHQFAQGLCLGIGNRPGRWPHRLGEMSDGRGLEPVGLGQFAGGTGKLADPARVDHRQPGDQRAQSLDEPGHTVAVARDGEGLTARPQMHLQPILRHVNPNNTLHVPSPACAGAGSCACGLAWRPRRLLGLREAADGAPGSEAGSRTLAGEGLPSATATPTLPRPCDD